MNKAKKDKLKKSMAGIVAILLAVLMVLGAVAPLISSMF